MAAPRRSLFENMENILGPADEESSCEPKAKNIKTSGQSLQPPKASQTSPGIKPFNLPKLVVSLERLNVERTEEFLCSAGTSLKDGKVKLPNYGGKSLDKTNGHVKLRAPGNKKHVRREQQDSGSQSSTSGSSDAASDDGDLEGVAFLTARTAKQNLPEGLGASYVDDPYVQPKYKFGIGSILSEREAQIESNLQLKKMEEELKEDCIRIDAEALPSEVLAENNLDVKDFLLPHTKIEDSPPGIDVLDPSLLFILYRLPEAPVVSSSDNLNPLLDQIFSQLDPLQLPNFIKQRTLERFPRDLSSRPWLMKYIFHLLASHPACDVMDACHRVLFNVQAHYAETESFDAEESWRPTVEDVVAVLVNYGAKLEEILLKGTVFSHMDMSFLRERFGSTADASSEITKQHPTHLPVTNLRYFLNTLESYIKCGLYSDEELLTLMFSLCSMALDKNLLILSLDLNFRDCIGATLQSFSVNYWETEINELALRLVELCVHHHNCVYLGQLMSSNNERTFQLKQLFCFLSLHNLLEVEVSKNYPVVTPIDVYQLVDGYPLVSKTDYYLLQSIFLLIDMSVGNDHNAKYKDNLEVFASLLKEMAAKIRDNVRCLDATRVKNLIVRISSKWTFTAQAMPTSQQNLFRYIPRLQQKLDDVENVASPQSDHTELSCSDATELVSLPDEQEDALIPSEEDDEKSS